MKKIIALFLCLTTTLTCFAMTGLAVSAATAEEAAATINTLYLSLPGTEANDFKTTEQVTNFEKLMNRYDNATDETKEILAKDYNITSEDIDGLTSLFMIIEFLYGQKHYGDVNNDIDVNNKDVLLLRKFMANMNVSINEDLADINSDNTINQKDLLLLRKHVAGMKLKPWD